MSMIAKKKCIEPGTATIDEKDGSIVISCRDCTQFPDPSSVKCISCICEAISECGAASKIKMIGIKDTELSGDAAEIFCDLSRICRPVVSNTKRKCANCPRSPERIYDAVWSEFPDMSFAKACSRIYTDSRDGPECAGCLQKTYLTLANCDTEMKKIEEKITNMAGRKN